MRRFIVLAAAFGLIAASAHAAPLSKPQIVQAYPEAAARASVGGDVRLECQATDDHKLTDCKVLDERPLGYRFGEAALKMATLFRIPSAKPGARVVIPIHFQMPGKPPAAPPTADPPPGPTN